MKAAIISLGSESSLHLAEALKKYFSQVEMLELKQMEVELGKEAGIWYRGEKLPPFDCIYLKGSFRYAQLLSSLASLLEGKIPYMPLKASAFTLVHHKLLTHLVLQQNNIPMPRTYVSSTVENAKELLKKVHYPVVMKFPEGTQGKGVLFAETPSSASALLDALGVLKQPVLVQEYIETEGTDIRALVVGQKVVAAMRRKAKPGEQRANIHAGGKGEAALLSRETAKVAVATATALGADVCGVDILESPLGPLVIEANISPGLQGLQQVTSLNIADQIAQYFAQKTREVLETTGKEATKEMISQETSSELIQEIITPLQFRGERILLPDFVSKLSQFNELQEYVLKIKKGKVEIEIAREKR